MLEQIKQVLIEEELKSSFLNYAMAVVVSRAIPDVRDGLKPVHRRILYTMHQLGLYYNKPYRKSVKVVGEVMAAYHPHGDLAIYSTMVGMVQDFSKRYPLLDGQGNWGSVDGDNAAAFRYTEVRMQKIAQEVLADLDKNTVDFVPNFDDTTLEPVLLPSKIPQLIINGTSGIAVGMATSIPPHNLREIVDGCLALLDDQNISDEKLFSIITAPDFPTGGIICGRAGIVNAYKTGRGNVIVRAVVESEETKKGPRLIITELPYQVIKADLIIKIADLVKNKIIEGISNIRDESDKKGMRLVIELRKGEMPDVVLNQLYKHTALQSSISILMLALLDNRPVLFSLRRMLQEFLIHREKVIYRRTQFDLEKALAREHLLHGFIIALNNIDEVIVLIKSSQTADDAIKKLVERFSFTAHQGKAILEMRLQRLTGLEQGKIRAEIDDLQEKISFLNSILNDKSRLYQEIKKELIESRQLYGDDRRSKIGAPIDILTEADLIPDDEVVVTLTHKGYIKRVALDIYGVQHRGGKGKKGMATLDEGDDIVQDVYVARNHDELLFFTNFGRIYSKSVYELPEGSRIAKGRAVINIVPLQDNERVVKLLCVRDLSEKNMVLVTKNGTIKRTDAQEFAKVRSTGIRAISLKDDDELVFCSLSSGNDSIVIATAYGHGIRFLEREVRVMGRQASGVRGIKLKTGDYVVGMQIVSDDKDILFATERGYGKRVRVGDFRVAHRGGFGVRTIPTHERNGNVIGLVIVDDESEILLIGQGGKIIRLSPKEVRTMGRQAKGVRLVRIDADQKIVGLAAFGNSDEDIDHDNHAGMTPARTPLSIDREIVESDDLDDHENDDFDDSRDQDSFDDLDEDLQGLEDQEGLDEQ